jgi:hypothetical protein
MDIASLIIGLVSLVIAGLAAWKARNAERAAREAREELRRRQAPWRLLDVSQDIGLLETAVGHAEWHSAWAVLLVLLPRVQSIHSHLLRLGEETLAETLGEAVQALIRAHDLVVNDVGWQNEEWTERARQEMLRRVSAAGGAVSRVLGELRAAAGQI